jgi:hypothetical protein
VGKVGKGGKGELMGKREEKVNLFILKVDMENIKRMYK